MRALLAVLPLLVGCRATPPEEPKKSDQEVVHERTGAAQCIGLCEGTKQLRPCAEPSGDAWSVGELVRAMHEQGHRSGAYDGDEPQGRPRLPELPPELTVNGAFPAFPVCHDPASSEAVCRFSSVRRAHLYALADGESRPSERIDLYFDTPVTADGGAQVDLRCAEGAAAYTVIESDGEFRVAQAERKVAATALRSGCCSLALQGHVVEAKVRFEEGHFLVVDVCQRNGAPLPAVECKDSGSGVEDF